MKTKADKIVESLEELTPINEQSFYHKALVLNKSNGDKTLYSYLTRIMTKKADGSLVRHYDDWSWTTGRHIHAFCGLYKKDYVKLPLEV